MSLERDVLEQYAADARDYARVGKATFDAFIEMGFPDTVAYQLTAVHLAELVRFALWGSAADDS